MKRTAARRRPGGAVLRASAALCALALTHCGSRTGLRVPDVEPVDTFEEPDARDETVAEDASDASDASDVLDASDASDVSDVLDVLDVIDAPDTRDVQPPPDVPIFTDTTPEVVEPIRGEPVHVALTFSSRIRTADVFFLVDNSASMDGIIRTLTTEFSRLIVPGIRAQVADARFGVGSFDSMPDGIGGEPGTPGDYTLWIRQRPTSDASAAQRAFNEMRTVSEDIPGFAGGDGPECQTEAVYEIIEGAGARGHEGDEAARRSVYDARDPRGNGWVPRVDPNRDCDPGAATRGAYGWGCFEPGRVPIIILASDADWYDGYAPGSPRSPFGHTSRELTPVMTRRGAYFVGIDVGVGVNGPTYQNSVPLALVTRTLNAAGRVVVFGPGSSGLSGVAGQIIDAVSTIAGQSRQDVTTRVLGDPAETRLPAGRTTADFVRAVTPAGATPEAPVGYERRDATTFYNVTPSTQVLFDITLQNTFLPTPPTAQTFRITVVVIGRAGAELDRRDVYFTVPGRA